IGSATALTSSGGLSVLPRSSEWRRRTWPSAASTTHSRPCASNAALAPSAGSRGICMPGMSFARAADESRQSRVRISWRIAWLEGWEGKGRGALLALSPALSRWRERAKSAGLQLPVQLAEPGAAGVGMVDPVMLVAEVVYAQRGGPLRREAPAQFRVGHGEAAHCAIGVHEVAVVQRAVLAAGATQAQRGVPARREAPVGEQAGAQARDAREGLAVRRGKLAVAQRGRLVPGGARGEVHREAAD